LKWLGLIYLSISLLVILKHRKSDDKNNRKETIP